MGVSLLKHQACKIILCLPFSFYSRSSTEVAPDLLGKILVWEGRTGMICETEAYGGTDDAASHAFKGPTARNKPMFGKPGTAYVYQIYGRYFCLNIVANKKDKRGVVRPGAVLIRGIYCPPLFFNGPGKLCQHLCVSKNHNGIDLTQCPDFCVAPPLLRGFSGPSLGFGLCFSITSTPRIGISKAKDKLWRFCAHLGTHF